MDNEKMPFPSAPPHVTPSAPCISSVAPEGPFAVNNQPTHHFGDGAQSSNHFYNASAGPIYGALSAPPPYEQYEARGDAPVLSVPDRPPPSYDECTTDCPHSEEDVREALTTFVKNSGCCTGSSPIREMKILEITPIHAFRYILETFSETRTLISLSEPCGNHLAYETSSGDVPDKWSVLANPPSSFSKSKMRMDLPQSVYVTQCNKCLATGFTSCHVCNGVGFSRCTWCSGTGKRSRTVTVDTPTIIAAAAPMLPNQHLRDRHHHHHPHSHNQPIILAGTESVTQEVIENCTSCMGLGRSKCTSCDVGRARCRTCKGHKFMRHWITLEIKWKPTMEMFVTPRGLLEEKRLRKAPASQILLNEVCPGNQPRPITANSSISMDSSIATAARAKISQQCSTQNENKKILQFRQVVEIIPVVKVIFKYKSEDEHFYIYGTERSVYFPDGYPASCCCCRCCSIL